jgi:hypothetical protein
VFGGFGLDGGALAQAGAEVARFGDEGDVEAAEAAQLGLAAIGQLCVAEEGGGDGVLGECTVVVGGGDFELVVFIRDLPVVDSPVSRCQCASKPDRERSMGNDVPILSSSEESRG